jgi:glycosyltransferase involved in cell wall biosynthesis
MNLSAKSMTKRIKVSIVIPCFNHGEFLPEAVCSAIAIKRDDIETIVVDDGSTDKRTREVMDALPAQAIKVIRQENKGLAAARNAGIVISRGEYILPLDADNRLRFDYVERGIRILDAKPQVGVVYGDAEYIGMRTGRWHVGSFERDRLLQWNYIDACAMYRRCIWEENRGYDGTMPVQGYEDWDFWLGALEHGWEFAYIPEIFFDYRQSKRSMTTLTFGFESQIEAFVASKHGLLYRQQWQQQRREHESVNGICRDIGRLFKAGSREIYQTARLKMAKELRLIRQRFETRGL